MTAEDFLDTQKRRIMQLDFDGFSIHGGLGGLLDVHLSEILNDEPDIMIGNLVVPELVFTMDNYDGEYLDADDFDGLEFSCKVGLEREHEDITDALLQIQEVLGKNLCIIRSCSGTYLVASGKRLYSCDLTEDGFLMILSASEGDTAEQEIAGMYLEEKADLKEGDEAVVTGRLSLYHTTPPYRTGYQLTMTKDIINVEREPDADASSLLERSVFRDLALEHYSAVQSTVRYPDGTVDNYASQIETIRTSYFERDILVREILNGTQVLFDFCSYGNFIITESTVHEDDVMEMTAYGELYKLVGVNAEDFFTEEYIIEGETLADVYRSFCGYLSEKIGMQLTAAEQEFLNLDKLIVTTIWADRNYQGITAARFLRELALLEGGCARVTADGKLLLGWCCKDPVLTLSANELDRLKISSNMPGAAEGLEIYDPRPAGVTHQNLVGTAIGNDDDMLYVYGLLYTKDIPEMLIAVIDSFSDPGIVPYSASAVCGGSPFLRAGETVRLISRAGAVIDAQVLMQDVSIFPMLHTELSAPDGTSWKTQSVPQARYLCTADGSYLTANGKFLVIGGENV